MSLPDLCLAPHEAGGFAFDEPLCAPAQYRVQVESGPCAGSYLIRCCESSYGGKAIIARRELPTSPLLYIQQYEGSSVEKIAENVEHAHVNRLLFFDSAYRLATSAHSWSFRLTIYSGDKSAIHWIPSTGTIVNIWRIREGANNRYAVDWKFDTPDKQIELDINEMLSDENSYFSIANWWAQLDAKEIRSLLIQFANGDLGEFRNYLRTFVWSLEGCENSVDWSLTLPLPMRRDYESDTAYFDQIVQGSKFRSKVNKYQLPLSQLEALKTILHHFYPHRNAELEDLLKSHDIWQRHTQPSLSVIVPIATAHERLEAQLELRDFLRDKLTAAELAELMPQ